MKGVIKILCLEDRKADFELSRQHIIRSFSEVIFTRAANEAEFLEKLERGSYDLILGDYNLPNYNGLSALLHVRKHHPHLPFIFVTGTLNSEESAAGAILQGANGYVLKDNIRTLPDHIKAVLAAAEADELKRQEQRAKKQARNLRLQKAMGLLQNSEDFPRRSEIIDLIADSMSKDKASA